MMDYFYYYFCQFRGKQLSNIRNFLHNSLISLLIFTNPKSQRLKFKIYPSPGIGSIFNLTATQYNYSIVRNQHIIIQYYTINNHVCPNLSSTIQAYAAFEFAILKTEAIEASQNKPRGIFIFIIFYTDRYSCRPEEQ